MLLRLAYRFTNEYDVRRLGFALSVPSHTVESTLTNNPRDICSAAYKVLLEWEKGQQFPTVACELLRNALKECNLHKLVYEVLDSSGGMAEKFQSKRKTGYKVFPFTLFS